MVADFAQLHHNIKQGFSLEFLVVVLLKNAFVSDLVVEDLLPLRKLYFDHEFLFVWKLRFYFFFNSS